MSSASSYFAFSLSFYFNIYMLLILLITSSFNFFSSTFDMSSYSSNFSRSFSSSWLNLFRSFLALSFYFWIVRRYSFFYFSSFLIYSWRFSSSACCWYFSSVILKKLSVLFIYLFISWTYPFSLVTYFSKKLFLPLSWLFASFPSSILFSASFNLFFNYSVNSTLFNSSFIFKFFNYKSFLNESTSWLLYDTFFWFFESYIFSSSTFFMSLEFSPLSIVFVTTGDEFFDLFYSVRISSISWFSSIYLPLNL